MAKTERYPSMMKKVPAPETAEIMKSRHAAEAKALADRHVAEAAAVASIQSPIGGNPPISAPGTVAVAVKPGA